MSVIASKQTAEARANQTTEQVTGAAVEDLRMTPTGARLSIVAVGFVQLAKFRKSMLVMNKPWQLETLAIPSS